MTPAPLADRRRALPGALLAVATCLLIALGSATPAVAAKKEKSCARQIIEDWYDNERIDKFYPLHCYHDAINSLGTDAQIYTNLPDAILRALAYAEAKETDPGPNGTAKVKPIAFRHTADLLSSYDGATSAAPRSSSTSGPASVPIPLIVLAGLAGVLLLAGGAGYVARRVQSRRGGEPPES